MANLIYFTFHVLGIDIAGCLESCSNPRHFHERWLGNYLRHKLCYICSARRHIKTTVTQAITTWESLRKKIQVLVVMNSHPQVKVWARNYMAMLQYAIDTLGLDVQITKSNETEIELSNGSIVHIRSLTSKIRTLSPDLIIVDDLLDENQNISFEKAEGVFRAAIFGTRQDHTRILYVGTILRQGDVLDLIRTGHIPGWQGGSYPAVPMGQQDKFKKWVVWWLQVKRQYDSIREETELGFDDWYHSIYGTDALPPEPERPTVLWPEVRSLEYLGDQYLSQGPYVFEVEYLLNPLSDELALVPRRLIDLCKDEGISIHDSFEGTSVMGVDLQISTSKDADYSVFLTIVGRDGKYYLVHMDRHRGMGYQYQLSRIKHLYAQFGHQLIMVESNSFQKILAQMMSNEYLPIEESVTGTEKHDMQTGVPSLRQLFESKQIVIPWKDEDSRTMFQPLVQELAAWQFIRDKGKFESKAKHDDTTMALWQAIKAVRKYQYSGMTLLGSI